jgi:hypothetical protein
MVGISVEKPAKIAMCPLLHKRSKRVSKQEKTSTGARDEQEMSKRGATKEQQKSKRGATEEQKMREK